MGCDFDTIYSSPSLLWASYFTSSQIEWLTIGMTCHLLLSEHLPWTALKEDWGPYQIGEEDRTTK